MDADAREKLEAEARGLFDARRFGDVATLLVRGYGPEIFGFLIGAHLDEQEASDIFGDFTEGVVRGLPAFQWNCSLRTWAYTIARNAAHHFRRDRKRRGIAGAGDSHLEELAHQARTSTLTFLKTQKKTRLQELRESLPAEDRELLILRLDRDLSWNDLALALNDGAELSSAELKAEAARLRKRFQLLKDRLREQARREGLIS